MMRSDLFTVHITHSAEETQLLGKAVGEIISENTLLTLDGELGAGKTTFIRGLAEAAGSIDPKCVNSPTFNFLHIYEGNKTIYHFDLYRLPNREEFFAAGFDEYLQAGGVCCIEWAEKLLCNPTERYAHFLSELDILSHAIFVRFSYEGPQGRLIEISKGSS